MSVRSAVPADFDPIFAVMDEWWGRPVRSILPRLFLDHFCDSSLIAEDAEGLAGFLVGFPSQARGDESYIHAAAVSPRCRRDGLGRELYRRFFDFSAAAGRLVVRAITSPFNDESIAFHRRLGFGVTDPIPDYDGPEVDRVMFHIDMRLTKAADR